MSKLISLVIFLTPLFIFAQNKYELIVKPLQENITVGNKVAFRFYLKNNSTEYIIVPSYKSPARGIGHILKHEFKVYDNNNKLLNQVYRCRVGGGSDRRVLSGVKVEPGDSILLLLKWFAPTISGIHKAEYVFYLHPNTVTETNIYKTINVRSKFEFTVKSLDFNFTVEENRISAEEMWKAPIYKNLKEALKNPNEVYRLKLQNANLEEINQIAKFKNIQDLNISLAPGTVIDSLPANLFELYYRSLVLYAIVTNGIKFPKSIHNSKELERLEIGTGQSLDLSGFANGSFTRLKSILIVARTPSLVLDFDVSKMPNLEKVKFWSKSIASMPWDYSNCSKLKSFSLSGAKITYEDELILPQLAGLSLSSNKTITKVPNLSKCEKLTYLNLIGIKIDKIPSHLIEIPNLNKLKIRKEIPKNETFKALKKKGVKIIRF